MSSRSPRGSLSGASTSAEVAADFGESLKDLQNNNRYEISNLTVIAQENTEHAQAISKALETHIKTTQATRKLPALFVLDSIVKNVGTPYTVYLGRNLYSTFMDAYTLVDSTTRRNMEAMLKTWKEPVPGSMDPRPVFPVETVRPIENALLKAKTAVLQSQRQPQVPYRGTATPPQHNAPFNPPPQQPTPQPFVGHHSQQPTPQPAQYGYPPPMSMQAPTQGPEELKREISSLIPRFHQKIASSPNDGGLRSQLGALEALHQMLGTSTFSLKDLNEIRNQVNRLSAALPPQPTPQIQMRPTPQPAVSTPQWQPPVPYTQPIQPPIPHFAPPPPHIPPPQPVLVSVPPAMTPNALNGLQALLANVQKPSTPHLRAAVPGFREASHSQLNTIQHHAAATPSTNGAMDLLASLTRAGLINPAAASTQFASAGPQTITQPSSDPNAILRSLVIPPSQGGTPAQFAPPVANATAQVPISAASLKLFRPELVRSLYDAQANQCNTCGRRFLPTEDGRDKKSKHLDWHFRTNQRIADPNTNRGHHRNWFVDEMDWIRHTEFDPSTTTAAAADAKAAAKPTKGPQDQYLRAPAGMTRNTCNICFEEMKTSYSDELQDWIFANAAMHNGRIVHATCLAEMTKPQLGMNTTALAAVLANVPRGSKERSATPDSLLGKRKAEAAIAGGGARLKME